MINQYPFWKNLLVALLLLVGGLLALPNIYSQDPVVEVSGVRGAVVDTALQANLAKALADAGITVKRTELDHGKLRVRVTSSTDQLRAQDVIARNLPNEYTHALNLSTDLPAWLVAIGVKPMNLGLDLRGGIHALFAVDMDAVLRSEIEDEVGLMRQFLRKQKIRYVTVKPLKDGIEVRFRDAATRDKAEDLAAEEFRDLAFTNREDESGSYFRTVISERALAEMRKRALDQNIVTLRNRVNALGVAEPNIQQQGDSRIVVELPGVQDPNKLKEIISATATLEYRLVVGGLQEAREAERTGRVPPGAKLYHERDGNPILLKRQKIVSGDQMTGARSGHDQQSGTPAVFVTLDGKGAKRMFAVTSDNVNKPMAVVFKEKRTVGRDAKGHEIKKWVEEVINVATIREPFGKSFQTSGLNEPGEAAQLALLLKAGALAAPMDIVEERTIGPSLGQDNIDQGFLSVMVGLVLVMVFMLAYYRVFGLVANLALLLNLVLIVGTLSLLQATLTLPGIAGIVLTVGMAVDANVLIFERIREELRVGSTPQASIHAGYAKAFSTILDANVTTFIAAVVLFAVGSGPVRGFAVTLAIGIATSMFTAIVGTRAVINLVYGGKTVKKLAV